MLQGDTQSYGKQHLLDDSEETCWNSDPGKEQFIYLQLTETVKVSSIKMMFQGGFVGTPIKVFGIEQNSKDRVLLGAFDAVDTNDTQCFTLTQNTDKAFKQIDIIFEGSTDFYGRVTVYKLDVFGSH